MFKAFKLRRLFAVVLLVAVALVLLNFQSIMKRIYNVDYMDHIYGYSSQYSVDPYLIMGIIKAESSFDAHAVSHKDAKGLMQITDDTAQWLAQRMGLEDYEVSDYRDPQVNIQMGCYYVRYLLDMFSYNVENALAAYNAGPNVVKRWLENSRYSTDGETLSYIPYRETERYINKVLNYEDVYKRLYG